MARSGEHNAPGLLAATELQFKRALYWLSEAPAGAIVGLETGDDVVVAGEGVTPIFEQDKNTVTDDAPLSNRSVSLWKTLAIWTEAERLGRLTDGSILIFCTNRIVPADWLITRLSQAQSDDDITNCIYELQKIAEESAESIASFCTEVAKDWIAARAVIRRVRLCDASTYDPLEEIAIIAIRLHVASESDYQHIVDGLAGWLHRYCYEHWHRREPAWVPRQAFDNQYHAILALLRRRRVVERPAWDIPIATDERSAAQSQFFFEQLIAIDLDDEGLEAAVSNYLRFRSERLRLTDEGDITEEDWSAFFSALIERWSRIRRLESARRTESEVHLGQAIYIATVETGHRELLAGSATESEYLTSGGYHRLADENRAHWHPRYNNTPGTDK